MTDNEIIKALECLRLAADVLDLINRQKAEIERLESAIESLELELED